MNSVFLENLKIHPDWKLFLTHETTNMIRQVESEILAGEFTPSAEKVLRFFELPLFSAKVIILGQDPYPQPGVATGRAFEVGTLKSWNEPFKNISLKNLVRALYKSCSDKVLTYNEIKEKLDNEFPLLSPAKLFIHWENQGVILLNTSFTCIPGKPGSHKKVWEDFTFQLLNYINDNYPSVTWFLWGNHAEEATSKLQIQKAVRTLHPMMCFDNPGRQNDFLYGDVNGFQLLQNEIDWTGFGGRKKWVASGSLF